MLKHIKPNPEFLPGFWEVTNPVSLCWNDRATVEYAPLSNHNEIMVIKPLVKESTCKSLVDLFNSSGVSAPVGVNGVRTDLGVGSTRTSGWSIEMADSLTHILKPYLAKQFVTDAFTATDWYQGGDSVHQNLLEPWEFVGVSPLLRFMRYHSGGEHFAHYDAGYQYSHVEDGDYRTLKIPALKDEGF